MEAINRVQDNSVPFSPWHCTLHLTLPVQFVVLMDPSLRWKAHEKTVPDIHCGIHDAMQTRFALLACCEGNPPVSVDYPNNIPAISTFDGFAVISLGELLNKQSNCWWFEAPRGLYITPLLCSRGTRQDDGISRGHLVFNLCFWSPFC